MTVAAGVPLVALTAWQCLFEYGQVSQGSKVLIHAGAGAVGRVAIQMAKNAGATVATSVSERGRPIVEALGADVIINYHDESFEHVVQGYDFVLDTVGGDTLNRSFQVVKSAGKVCSISALPEPRTADDLNAGLRLRALFWLISAGLRFQAWRNTAVPLNN